MRIVAGCAEKLGEEELRAIRARQAVLENFTSMYQPQLQQRKTLSRLRLQPSAPSQAEQLLPLLPANGHLAALLCLAALRPASESCIFCRGSGAPTRHCCSFLRLIEERHIAS